MWSKKDVIRETRWSRTYQKPDDPKSYLYYESRFKDGSATITLSELKCDWDKWSVSEKLDFVKSFRWSKTPEREDILRFLIHHGDHNTWAMIALHVARELPTEESVPVISRWSTSCDVGRGANYYQAIAHTNAPEAHTILKDAYKRTLRADGLMDPAAFSNWIAHDLICCLEYLLKLNENPDEYREIYNKLKHHPNKIAKYHVQWRLTKYFEEDLVK